MNGYDAWLEDIGIGDDRGEPEEPTTDDTDESEFPTAAELAADDAKNGAERFDGLG